MSLKYLFIYVLTISFESHFNNSGFSMPGLYILYNNVYCKILIIVIICNN